jgi:dihydrofolate reductase
MRKIVVGMFVSLDGVTEAPEKWTFPYFSDEIGMHMGSNAAASDAMLLGRVTYDAFKASFSSQTGGMADGLNNMRKVVVSTTLKSADWNNSTLIKGNVLEEIARLKQQPGRNILVPGSITLVQSLMRQNLIDEYSLLVYPIVLGAGQRLFPEAIAKMPLKLIEAKSFSTGVVLMRYQPDKTE